MRTDANNLVTTASTTHLPNQKETIHMISMLRHEASSGSIADLGHVRTADMLADVLTKHGVKPDTLIKSVDTGVLPNVDASPEFRSLLKHKAYLVHWMAHNLEEAYDAVAFLGISVARYIHAFYVAPRVFSALLNTTASLSGERYHSYFDDATTTAWHQHHCTHCDQSFTHFHDIDATAVLHEHDNAVCCHVGCPAYYGTHSSTEHNPYHCTCGSLDFVQVS